MTLPIELLPLTNIILIAFIALMLIYGYFRGFLLQVYGLIVFIVVSIVSWLLAPPLAKVFPLMSHTEAFNVIPRIGPLFQETLNTILWFILIVVALMVASLFFKPLLKGITKLPIIKTVNRILGLLLGGLKAVVALLLLMLILGSGFVYNGQKFIDGSLLGQLKPVSASVITAVADKLDSTGLVSKIMLAQPFTDEEVVTLNAWLADQGVATAVVPILSKVLRLEPIPPAELAVLVQWMRDNGISEEDLQNFLDHHQ